MNKHAIEKLYRKHRDGLFTVALSITRRADLAEDAIHTAFMRLCRKDDLEGDMVPYIYTAVRNAAIDIYRSKKHTMPIEETIFVPIEHKHDQPIAMLEKDEQQDLLQRRIDELPEDQKQIIIMKHYTDLTFRQIAKMLDEPLATIASRYRRTLERLKSKLGAKI